MNYQSPIELIQSQMRIAAENEILKAVQRIGVNVDKEELLKALAYDRDQYMKGYNDRDHEIVRCKDCRHCYFASNRIPCEQSLVCEKTGNDITPDWFCADGEQKEGR